MRIKPRRLLSVGHRSDTHHFCSDFIGQNSVLLLLLLLFFFLKKYIFYFGHKACGTLVP